MSTTLLLFSLLASFSTQDSSSEVLHPDFAPLAERWRGAMADLGVPGAALVVVERGEVLHLQTMGLRDVVNEKPVTPDTMFYIASATKPFVAFATTMLAEEGRLELDAPVREYLPRFELANEEATASITVRDLLCHRPGLNSFPIVFLDAYTGEITEDRYYHFLQDVDPRGRVTYTNLHFTLAGRVLEAVTGDHWKEVLRERIFAPLGMEHTTGYADWMYAHENVAYPSKADPSTRNGFAYASVRKIDETMHAAGGLGISVRDAARWLSVHLEEGELDGARLLSAAGVAEVIRSQSKTNDRPGVEGFGLGWMRTTSFDVEGLQHGGGYVGSASLFSFVPEIGIGVAVLANIDSAGHALCELVTEDVYAHMLAVTRHDPLPELTRRATRRRSAALPEGANPALAEDALTLAPASYAGAYEDDLWGTVVLELDEGGSLRGNLGNVRLSLHTRGKDQVLLFAQGAVECTAEFVLEGDVVVGLDVDMRGNPVSFRRGG